VGYVNVKMGRIGSDFFIGRAFLEIVHSFDGTEGLEIDLKEATASKKMT